MAAAKPERQSGKALIARRNLVGLAGGLAAKAAFAPARSLAQVFSQTTISKAAQDARRDAGWFGQRADNLLRIMVADGREHSARAVTQYRHEQGPFARQLAALFNNRVNEDDWLLVVPTRELDLALAMQPLAIRLAPSAEEVEASLKQPLPQVEPLSGDDAADVLHTIILTNLGIERRVALFEQMRNNPMIGPPLKDTADAVKAEHYGLAAMGLEHVMRGIVQQETVDAITDNLGTGTRYKFYKSLTVRFVPFIGWTYFVMQLLATIYYNRDTTATVLR
ncbi:MAG TPA: hypothetical protein VEJ40_01055 [Pseudolabrys sp.]|nr:hypothetical protein [Pseudolabrys sp.]